MNIDLEQENTILKQEIEKLKLRPPMGCFSCEELNQKLADEVSDLRAMKIPEERETLAYNAWLAALNTDYVDPEENSEASEIVYQHYKNFRKWYDNFTGVSGTIVLEE